AARTTAASTQQEATKLEVRIRVREKANFRPGMSVTAEIETRHRTNVLAVPIQSVTTRPPKGATNAVSRAGARTGNSDDEEEVDDGRPATRRRDADKPSVIEVVFVVKDGRAVM